MNSIYEYDSYRKYLLDYFQEMKSKRKTFSYRYFSKKAGFTSCGFCHQVITGLRKLTPVATNKMIQGIGLDHAKAHYFRALVRFEQASSSQEKEVAFSELNGLRKNSAWFKLHRGHIRYFENWWYPVLRNLVVYAPWGNDYELLSQLITPPITEKQARQGVHLLKELNLIDQDDTNSWFHVQPMLNSEQVSPHFKLESRRETLQLGLEALDRFPSSQRHATYYTLAISENSYKNIVNLIEDLNNRSSILTSEDQNVEQIYELAVLLYPLSKKFRSKL